MQLRETLKKKVNDSLNYWMKELRGFCESECMNTLQSKSLYVDSSGNYILATQSFLVEIQRQAHTVSAEFALLCQRLENLDLDQVPVLASLKQQVKVVDQICNRLIEICSETIILSNNSPNSKDGADEAVQITKSPSKFERQIFKDGEVNRELIREFIQISLVNILEDESSIRLVEKSITELTGLGLNGGHICQLISRVGGIRALLGVCIESRFKKLRSLALRALATVCCVAEGITSFEKEGGVDVISEILCDAEIPEEERSEAAGVLAQITSPWVEDNHSLPCLKGHLKGIVKALTAEVFLLTSAALANLTFLDVSVIEALLSSSTHKVLLTAAKVEENLSVFTKDQIATILANMSSSSEATKEIVESGGIDVLLSLLMTGPSASVRIAEVSATERIQQKSAIALSRICNDPEAANRVLAFGGASRLVELCRNEKERSESDAVLVACLAALRKIASSCGKEVLREVNASELIEPKLL
ncbi:Protein inscuteable-like protein, partial [Armadillidium nasatum]